MRISPLQLQIQLQSLKQDTVSSKDIKVGDVLKALVLKVEPEQLTLALNNQTTVMAKVEDVSRFATGETLNFEVVQADEGPIKVEVLNQETKQVNIQANIQSAKEGIQSLKMDLSTENIKAFVVLKSLGMNASKENILTLTQNFKALNVIHDQVGSLTFDKPPESSSDLLNQLAKQLSIADKAQVMETPIKTIAIEVLDIQKTPTTTGKVLVEGNVDKTVAGSTVGETSLVSNSKPMVSAEMVKSAFGLMVDVNSNQLEIEDTMVKITQLMQLDKPLTMNSLSLLDKLNFEFNLETQLEALTKELESLSLDDKPKLMNLLKGFDINQLKSSDEVQKYFEVLLSELEDVKGSMGEKGRGQVDTFKNSVRFLEQEQPQVNWIQIPIQINDKTRNLDMLIKENFQNKQNSNHKTKILIALNTHHLDMVQAFIEVQPKKLKIEIKVMDDKIESLFNRNINQLKEILREEKEEIDIVVSSAGYIGYSEFVEDASQGTFNIKV